MCVVSCVRAIVNIGELRGCCHLPGLLEQTTTEWIMTKILSGQKQIQNFVGRRWDIIIRWITKRGFPAKKIDGIWESDTDMILEWRRGQIEQKSDVNI